MKIRFTAILYFTFLYLFIKICIFFSKQYLNVVLCERLAAKITNPKGLIIIPLLNYSNAFMTVEYYILGNIFLFLMTNIFSHCQKCILSDTF